MTFIISVRAGTEEGFWTAKAIERMAEERAGGNGSEDPHEAPFAPRAVA